MHELSLCRSLIATLEQEADNRGLRRIFRVEVAVGCLSCIEPEALRFSFGAVGKPPCMDDCELSIRRVPGQAVCLDCNHEYPVRRWLDVCPRCGSEARELSGGDRIVIDQMEVC